MEPIDFLIDLLTVFARATVVIFVFQRPQPARQFSFILAGRELELHLIDRDIYQTFLAASVLTMASAPLLLPLGPRLFARLLRKGEPESLEGNFDQLPEQGHVILLGYGMHGRHLARALKRVNAPYLIVEKNPETVREARRTGEPIFYGDCSRPAILHNWGLQRHALMRSLTSIPAFHRKRHEEGERRRRAKSVSPLIETYATRVVLLIRGLPR